MSVCITYIAYLRPEEAMCKKDFDSEIKAYLAKNSEDGNSLMLLTINFV